MSLIVVVKNANVLSPNCDIIAQMAIEQITQKSTGFYGHVFDLYPIIKIRKGTKSDLDVLKENGFDIDIIKSN